MNVIHNLFHYLEHVIELTLVDNHMITFFTLECKGIHMIFDLLNISYEDTSASAADKVVGQSVLAQITKLTPKVVETIQEKPALVTVTPTTSKTAMPQMTPTQPLIGMNPIPFGMPTPNLSIAPLFGNSPTPVRPRSPQCLLRSPSPAQTTVTPTITTTAVAATDLSQLLSKNNIPMNNPDKYSEEFAKDMKCSEQAERQGREDHRLAEEQEAGRQAPLRLPNAERLHQEQQGAHSGLQDGRPCGPADHKGGLPFQYNDYGPKIVGEPSYINIHYKARESDAWSFLSTLDVFEDNGFYIGGNVCYQKNYLRMSGDTLAERISSMCIPKRIEYLRFLIGRPLISFQENYSQLKAKDYELPNLAPSFISILGINSNNYNLQIQNNYLKETSLLKLIQKIFSKDFKSLDALANQPELIEKFKIIFDRLIEEFVELFTAPLVSFSKNNPEFGLWVITKLLDLKYKEEHAKVVGEIVISCAEHYSDRMSLLLQFILREVGLFNDGKKPHNKRLFDYMTVFASCVHRGPRATADLKASCVLPLGQDEFNSLIEYYMKMSYVQQIKNFFITLVHLPNNTFKILIDRPMDYMMQLLSDRITQQDQFVLAELLSLIVISKQEYSTIILSKKAIKDEMQPENNGIVDFLMQKLANLGGKDKISVLLFFRNIINHEACKQVIEDKKFPLVVFEELKSYLKQIKTNEKAETNIILMLDIIKFVISTSHNTAVEFAQVLFNYCQEIMKSPEDDMSFMGKIFFPILSTIKTYRVCFSRKMAVKYATDMDETTQKSETEGQKTFNSEFMVQDSLPTLYSNVETLTDSSICDKFKNGKWECVVKSMGSGSDLSQQIEDNLLGKGTFLIVIDGESNNIEYTLGVFCSGGLPKDPSMAKGSRDITIPNSDNDFLFLYEKAGKQNTFHYRTKTSQDVENNFIKYTDKGEGADKGIIVYYQNMEKVFLSFTDATTSHIDLYPMKCLETDPVPNFEFPYDFHIKRGVEIWRLSVPDASAQGQQKKNSNLISMGPLDFKNEILNISYSYYRINTVYNIPSNISLKNLRKAFFADETVSFKYLGAETPIDAEKTFEEIKAENVPKDELEIIDLEYDQDIDIKEVNLNDLRDLYSPQIMILEEFNKIEGMEFIMKFCLNIVKTSAEWVDKPYASNWEQIIKEIQLFSKIDNFIATFTRNPDSIQIILKIFSKSNIPEAQWKTNEEIILSNIYTAVGNLYKFDKSSKIRNQAVEEGIFQMILERLQTISKETSRKFVEAVEEKEEKVDIKEKPSEKKDASKVVQRKGVGYEGVVTTNWSTEEFFKLNEAKNKKIKSMLYIILNILELENWEAPEGILRTVSESCILPLMENAFRCSSLLEMAKEKELYELYLDTCVAISKIEPLIGSLLKLDERYQPQQTSSIEHLLQQLSSSSHIFKKLATGDQKATNDPNSIAFQLAEKIIKCYDSIKEKLVDSKAYNEQMMNEFKNIKDMPMEKAYKLLLAEQRFGYTNMKSPTDPNTYIHHWKSLFTGKYAPQPTKMVRLAQEIADISNSLPIDSTNAMFVRADEERLDVMKSVIFGAEGSPYAHGAFEYDIFFENDYPNIAPKVNLETTGNGDVRFNPNLYACGKVCLSLLGTWRGNASESWDPKISTLSQVLVSIQAVVMSEEVYFNEPGHGHEAGTEGGELKNTAYANIVKLCNIKYAMTGQIENPSKGFENAIRCHFVLKKDKVLETVEKWKKLAGEEEATYIGLVADHNHSYCDRFKNKSTAYLEEITAAIDKLKLALDKLEMPPIEALLGSKVSGGKLKKEKKADIAITDGQANISEIDMTYDDTIQLKSMENDEAGVKDRWSRYIGVMGMESVTKQANAEVLISGMNSLGIEVAKNVILSGLKRLSIHDAKTTDLKDLSGQFFLSEADVGKNRASACINKLAQLNTYVKVDLVGNEKQIPTDEKELETLGFKDYDVVVLIDTPHEVIAGVSNFCRQHDIKLIVADCHGIFSRVFNDFGPKFTCFDKNGEEAQEVMVSSITVEEVGKVTLLEGVKHTLEDGDTIILRGVEGMLFTEEAAKQLKEGEKVPESVNGLLFKVKVINFNSFTIGDTRGFSPYVRGGLAKQIKLPIEMEFKPYNEVYDTAKPLYEPNLEIHDFMKVGHSQILHLAYLALNLFYAANKRLPDAYSLADAKSFYEIALKKNTDLAQFIKLEESEKLLKKLLYMFSMTAQGNFSPQSAYIGGVVCQEIIKAITGKFSPIKQTFYADSLEILCEAIFVDNMHELEQKDFDALVSQAGVLPKNDRDDGLRLLVGENLLDKIKYTNLFMVGSGAIGCELLKNYAMIGLGTGKVDEKHTKSGKIVLTDPDVIELSNLNRQFLFREKHLRKPKSVTAAAAAQMMNPQLQGNLLARLDKVHEGTSNIFTDKFFEEMNIVTNALDNVQARKYIDQRCVSARTPLIESGTLGPKGHVQVIIPNKTESYGSMKDPVEELDIPFCTLKMFPEETLHCVEWARDLFGSLFTLKPQALRKCLTDLKDGKLNAGEIKALKDALDMLKNTPKNFEDCIAWARNRFQKYVHYDIRQLMHVYPLDSKDKEGSPFWKLPKRPPTHLDFDPANKLHQDFVIAAACLRAKVFQIELPKTIREEKYKEEVGQTAAKVVMPEFKPSEEKAKEISKDIEKQNKKPTEMEEAPQPAPEEKVETFDDLKNEFISKAEKLTAELITPEEFEKDCDTNYHIDFIYSLANLRASNYKLDPMDWMTVKIKAGRIVPALGTTTASIAGLQTLELVKVLKEIKVADIKNAFLNLAVPILTQSEPGEAPKIKLTETLSVTLWDRWEIEDCSEKTFNDVFKHIEEKYGVFPRDVMQGAKSIYMKALGGDKILKTKLIDTFEVKKGDTEDLTITCSKTAEDKTVFDVVPIVRLHF
jgi:ubiquitin-activating enzyme E1